MEKSDEWELLESGLTEDEVKEFLRIHLPKSLAYQTNRDFFCKECFENNKHKAKQKLRKCAEENCPVKYNCLICECKNIASISQKNVHNHTILEFIITKTVYQKK
ncbi:unnamed protein product [Brachionus calyciflorus]|uniref:Uncharacterized protein n=1 Tax=Brachionus calyciflorus TaxID=104777 RepID=A0A814CL23_9BILA|nr:unnamed protein product [Brachionus calyciflorus]